MKPLPLLLLLCCAASLPPMPTGSVKLYSPKDAEFRRSLVRSSSINPAIHQSTHPSLARFNALTPQFQITNLAVSPGSATVEWQGGVPPVWVLKSPDLLTWQPDGDPTTRTSHTVATTAAQMFFRVRQSIPLLLTQTNAPRLIWRIPELMPADTFASFKIERSDSGVAGDETTNGTLGGSPVTLATLTNKTTVGGAGFRIPVPGANVIKDASGNAISSVTVGDSSWMTDPLGAVYLNVPGKGLFKVISRPDATHVVLQYDITNGQASGSIPPSLDHQGENVVAGTQLVPGSYNDPTQPNPTFFYRVTGKTANNIDTVENVVSLSTSAPGSAVWANSYGSIGNSTKNGFDYGYAVAIEKVSGNIFLTGVCGPVQGGLSFGGPTLTLFGDKCIYLAKFSPSGSYLAASGFGPGAGNTVNATGGATGVAVRSAIVIMVGNIGGSGTFDFSSNAQTPGAALSPSNGGGFIARYTDNGSSFTYNWVKQFNVQVLAVTIDSDNNVLVTGNFSGTVNFGDATRTALGTDCFILKLRGSDGLTLWSKRMGSAMATPAAGKGIAVDSQNDVLVTGLFSGDTDNVADFGDGHSLTSTGTSASNVTTDFFVAKYRGTDGLCRWAVGHGGTGNESGTCITVDTGVNFHDDVIVGGYVSNPPGDLGGQPYSFSTAQGAFIAKYSGTDGSFKWGTAFNAGSSFGQEGAYGISVDSDGAISMAGFLLGSATLSGVNGPITISSESNNGIFVTKWTGAGSGGAGVALWAKAFPNVGGPFGQASQAYACAVGPDKAPVVAGYFVSTDANGNHFTMTFDSITVPDIWALDIFLVKLAP